METLEKSRMCRLCGKSSGISINIFDKQEQHVRKINAILPILVHEMDMLPKQMCHRCSYKLEEFYNFYVDCAKTDAELKSQLSWMKKDNVNEKIITPMVKVNPFKIKAEPTESLESIDSKNVVGNISDNLLLLPVSFLQDSYKPDTMLPCSRCQCLSDGNIKINKHSPKEVTTSRKKELSSENNSTNVCPSTSNKNNELNNETKKNIDINHSADETLLENNSINETNIKDISVVNLDNNDLAEIEISDNNVSKSENRALRPRRGSVDYMGQKKKGIATNIKTKLKSKLDMLDPALVNPVHFKVSQNNTIHSSPIIKLEKVDNNMPNLRARKNLEEFNRKIKEFCKKEWQFRKNKSNENRRSLHKEERIHRKSLQKEENQDTKNFQEGNLNSKSLSKETNSNRTSFHNEETHQENKSSPADETQMKNHLETNCKEQPSNSDSENTINENVIRVNEIKVKQELVNKITDNGEVVEETTFQEKVFTVESLKDQKHSKPVDRHPLCAVVKLEKDYTCNVDYPRIKIKRHLAIANPSKSKDVLEAESEQKSIFQLVMKNKPFVTNDTSVPPKNLRSKEKRLKVTNNLKKVSKKKSKEISKLVLEKNLPVIQQVDLKHYCDECDRCFKNRELFNLHPCYQK